MNRKNLSWRILGIVIVCLLFSFTVKETHYYVVIGAFSSETNARKFTGYARNLYLDASYKFNAARSLYYVYAMETARKNDARNWSLYLKHEKGFGDAWVYTSLPVEYSEVSNTEYESAEPSHPRYTQELDLSTLFNREVASSGTAESIAKYQTEEQAEAAYMAAGWVDADDIRILTGSSSLWAAAMKPAVAHNDLYRFHAQTVDGKTVPAEITLVDYKKAKKVASFKTEQYVGLRGAKRNQTLTLVCDLFGYSVETKVVNLSNPSRARDVNRNSQGVWDVTFTLRPMKENEISILYNTTFYKDAAVLMPSAKPQLDQVVSLMKEHPTYKILLHSHCNKGPRRDLRLPAKGADCFDLEASVKKGGNDKQLTKARGEAIKSYLVANGIDSKRVDIFAWGSLDNLVSPTSANTAINDRIEVELVHN